MSEQLATSGLIRRGGVYQPNDLLRDAAAELERGWPVVIQDAGSCFLLTPAAAVGHAWSRQLSEMPIVEIEPVDVTASVQAVCDHPADSTHLPVVEGGEPVGVVSRLHLHEALAARRDATTADERAHEDRGRLRQERLAMMGQLTGGIAHDFNNLLTVIMTCADSIGQSGLSEGSTQDSVESLIQASERAAGMVRELLAFSKREPVLAREITPAAVVEQLTGVLRQMAGKAVELELDVSGECLVQADPLQIERIVLNLVGNAREALPGTGRIVVTVADVAPGEAERPAGVWIRVTDDGAGMDAATLAQAFEPFFSTKGERGTGLGLATVRGTVQQLGGQVHATSTPGKGTAVEAWLPQAVVQESTPLEPSPAVSFSHPPRILVIDEDAAVRDVVQRTLHNAGYSVSDTTTAASAGKLLAEGGYDLVLLDRASEALMDWSDIPSGGEPVLLRMAAMAQPGSDEVFDLAKPFDATTLLETVVAAVGPAGEES